jgi:hydrogenase maturation protein HypF
MSRVAAERRAVIVRGIVQGVGFRPFIHGLASDLALTGFVRNRSDGLVIEVQGDRDRLATFVERVRTGAPPLARIEGMEVQEIPRRMEAIFRIEASQLAGRPAHRFFSPDIATCGDCSRELQDPRDRRYRYPFINCTSCGPRFTITCGSPYDRQRTTMAAFAMCDACRAEYEDPRNRRFHAQPIGCPACGPRLMARGPDMAALDADPLRYARELLDGGYVLAVKGLGGYHLACDATSEAAVARLRRRKQRDDKPLALLVADLKAARSMCEVSDAEAELLASPRSPIVLLRRLARPSVASGVAPGNPWLGLMLPYTPLHHLLARELGGRPLVLTSANRSDEPIAYRDDEAAERLKGIADGFVTHDRPIHLPCDDSVARVVGGRASLVRRSRGHAPEPIGLPFSCPQDILALGGHLKSTFALGRGSQAFLSHHLGDLGDHGSYRAFQQTVAHYETLFAFQAELVVHDEHPGYATTSYARQRATEGARLMAVQHHHAHMASCMAENGLSGPAIGVTFDGTGHGSDGSSWGGEFLVGDYRAARRAAHLRTVPLPGGEQAIRQPWRMALCQLLDCGKEPAGHLPGVSPPDVRLVRRMIERQIHSPPTSSAGRLFDAVAALLGLRARVSFEGQAAMELEALASTSAVGGSYPFELTRTETDGPLVVDTRPLVAAVADAQARGGAPADIARRFHRTIAQIVLAVVLRIHEQTAIGDVVLSGGVFMNMLLLQESVGLLGAAGLRVHTHTRVPPNDGGLSLGQLAVAAARLRGGC